MSDYELEEPSRRIYDRVAIVVTLLILAAFLISVAGVATELAQAVDGKQGGDDLVAKRDPGDDGAVLLADDDDEDDGDSATDRSRHTATGTTRGTGPSHTATNDTATGTRTRGHTATGTTRGTGASHTATRGTATGTRTRAR